MNNDIYKLVISLFDENNENILTIDFSTINNTSILPKPFDNIVYYKKICQSKISSIKEKINLCSDPYINFLSILSYTQNNTIKIIKDPCNDIFLNVVEFILNNIKIHTQKYIFRNDIEISLPFHKIILSIPNNKIIFSHILDDIYYLEYYNINTIYKNYIILHRLTQKQLIDNKLEQNTTSVYEPIGSVIVYNIINRNMLSSEIIKINNEKIALEHTYQIQINKLQEQIKQLEYANNSIKNIHDLQTEISTQIDNIFADIKNKYMEHIKNCGDNLNKFIELENKKITKIDDNIIHLNKDELIAHVKQLYNDIESKNLLIIQKNKQINDLMVDTKKLKTDISISNNNLNKLIETLKLNKLILENDNDIDVIINSINNIITHTIKYYNDGVVSLFGILREISSIFNLDIMDNINIDNVINKNNINTYQDIHQDINNISAKLHNSLDYENINKIKNTILQNHIINNNTVLIELANIIKSIDNVFNYIDLCAILNNIENDHNINLVKTELSNIKQHISSIIDLFKLNNIYSDDGQET